MGIWARIRHCVSFVKLLVPSEPGRKPKRPAATEYFQSLESRMVLTADASVLGFTIQDNNKFDVEYAVGSDTPTTLTVGIYRSSDGVQADLGLAQAFTGTVDKTNGTHHALIDITSAFNSSELDQDYYLVAKVQGTWSSLTDANLNNNVVATDNAISFQAEDVLYYFGTDDQEWLTPYAASNKDVQFIDVDGYNTVATGVAVEQIRMRLYGGSDSIYYENSEPTLQEEQTLWVWGGEGQDLLSGFGAESHFYGGADIDAFEPHLAAKNYFYGDGDNDHLYIDDTVEEAYGGTGNDLLEINGGVSEVHGGEGNDTILGYSTGGKYYGDAGNDEITVTQLDGTLEIYGNDGNDSVSLLESVGSAKLDVDLGSGTNSAWIGGEAGMVSHKTWQDISSSSSITFTGGSGSDQLNIYDDATTTDQTYKFYGTSATRSSAPTIAYSNFESLYLSAGKGSDKITLDSSWASANATIYGNNGNDEITAGNGAAKLYGGSGNDTLTSGSGNDILSGDGGTDALTGGSGDDTYSMWTGTVTITDSSGNDTVDFSSFGLGVTIDLSKTSMASPTGLSLSSTVAGVVENVIGTAYADKITGTSAANRIVGGAGDDELIGGDGSDTYIFNGTGLGSDKITEVKSDGDIDHLDFSGFGSAITLDLGKDTLQTLVTGTKLTLTNLDAIEQVTGTSYNDTLDGDDNNNLLDGYKGDDKIYGHDGDDIIKLRGISATSLTVEGGDGVDQFYFDEAAEIYGYRYQLADTVFTRRSPGSGSVMNTVQLVDFESLDLHAGSGDNTFTISGETSISPIHFDGGSGTDKLIADDSAATTAYSYRFEGTSLIREWEQFDDATLVSESRTLTESAVETVQLNTGSSDDTVNVHAVDSAVSLTVDTGIGSNTINVGSTGHSLDAVLGAVVVLSTGGNATLNIDDSEDTTSNTYSIENNQVRRTNGSTITINYSGITHLNLTTPADETPATVNILSTGQGTFTTVTTGADDDAFVIGDEGTLTGILGGFVLNAGDGNDLVTFNDASYEGNRRIQGSGTHAGEGTNAGEAAISVDTVANILTGMEEILVYAGSGDDQINFSSVPGIATEMHGGDGSDTLYGGSLADLLYGDDGDDFLAGGDGSDQLIGGEGNDQFSGGAEDDRFDGNWSPILSIDGAETANAGGVYTLTLHASRPGVSWIIDWDDGNVEQIWSDLTQPTITHTYAVGGSYTISGTAEDEDDDDYSFDPVEVTVAAASTFIALTGSNGTAVQGSSYTLHLSYEGPSAGSITGGSIDWGDGGSPEPFTGQPSTKTHTYTTVGLKPIVVTPTGVTSVETEYAVIVNPTSTAVSLSGGSSASSGEAYSLSISASGTGSTTVAYWIISWGDGTASTIVKGTGSSSISVDHDFPVGQYKVSVKAYQSDGTTIVASESKEVTSSYLDNYSWNFGSQPAPLSDEHPPVLGQSIESTNWLSNLNDDQFFSIGVPSAAFSATDHTVSTAIVSYRIGSSTYNVETIIDSTTTYSVVVDDGHWKISETVTSTYEQIVDGEAVNTGSFSQLDTTIFVGETKNEPTEQNYHRERHEVNNPAPFATLTSIPVEGGGYDNTASLVTFTSTLDLVEYGTFSLVPNDQSRVDFYMYDRTENTNTEETHSFSYGLPTPLPAKVGYDHTINDKGWSYSVDRETETSSAGLTSGAEELTYDFHNHTSKNGISATNSFESSVVGTRTTTNTDSLSTIETAVDNYDLILAQENTITNNVTTTTSIDHDAIHNTLHSILTTENHSETDDDTNSHRSTVNVKQSSDYDTLYSDDKGTTTGFDGTPDDAGTQVLNSNSLHTSVESVTEFTDDTIAFGANDGSKRVLISSQRVLSYENNVTQLVDLEVAGQVGAVVPVAGTDITTDGTNSTLTLTRVTTTETNNKSVAGTVDITNARVTEVGSIFSSITFVRKIDYGEVQNLTFQGGDGLFEVVPSRPLNYIPSGKLSNTEVDGTTTTYESLSFNSIRSDNVTTDSTNTVETEADGYSLTTVVHNESNSVETTSADPLGGYTQTDKIKASDKTTTTEKQHQEGVDWVLDKHWVFIVKDATDDNVSYAWDAEGYLTEVSGTRHTIDQNYLPSYPSAPASVHGFTRLHTDGSPQDDLLIGNEEGVLDIVATPTLDGDVHWHKVTTEAESVHIVHFFINPYSHLPDVIYTPWFEDSGTIESDFTTYPEAPEPQWIDLNFFD